VVRANEEAERLALSYGKIGIAGSDSHTLAGIARTYTEVPGARTVEEFFAGLRARRGRIRGDHGSLAKITADVFRITGSLFQEKPWTIAMSPLAVLLPAVTVGHWFNEIRFCKNLGKKSECQRNRSAPALGFGREFSRSLIFHRRSFCDEVTNGCSPQRLGIHRTPRSSLDAAPQSLARASLDSLLDAHRHPPR